MANESITVAFGADLSALGSGIRGARGMVKSLRDELSSSEIFGKLREGLAFLGVGVGVEKLAGGFREAAHWAKELLETAEELGSSAEFLQEFEFAARRSGSSTEAADIGLKRLVETIGHARAGSGDAAEKFEKWGVALTDVQGNGLSVQQVVEGISKKAGEIEDPTKRAAMAFDLMGKKGIDLVNALKDFDALRSKADKSIVNERELAALDGVARQMETAGTLGKHVAAFFASIYTWRDFEGEMIKKNLDNIDAAGVVQRTEEQIHAAKEYAAALEELKKAKQITSVTDPYLKALLEQKEAQLAFNAAKDGSIEKLKTEKTLLEKKDAVQKQLHEMDKKAEQDKDRAREKQKAEDAREKQAAREIRDARQAITQARNNYQTSLGDRSRYSLEELADMGRTHYQNRQFETDSERTAVDVQNIETQSKQARLYGNPDYADSLQKQALELRKSLGGVLQSQDADPMASVRQSIDKTEQHLQDLLNQSKGPGLKVQTSNGHP